MRRAASPTSPSSTTARSRERISPADGQPHLWLRRLPGGLPVEPLRPAPRATTKLQARADLTAPRLAELAALDDAGFRAMFQRLADQAHRPRPFRAQRADRDRQLGRPFACRRRRRILLSDPNPVVAEAAAWAMRTAARRDDMSAHRNRLPRQHRDRRQPLLGTADRTRPPAVPHRHGALSRRPDPRRRPAEAGRCRSQSGARRTAARDRRHRSSPPPAKSPRASSTASSRCRSGRPAPAPRPT